MLNFFQDILDRLAASQILGEPRSLPVFVLYSLRAASRIDWNWEEDGGVWEDGDMAQTIGGLLMMIGKCA